jgi:hypothetical protein
MRYVLLLLRREGRRGSGQLGSQKIDEEAYEGLVVLGRLGGVFGAEAEVAGREGLMTEPAKDGGVLTDVALGQGVVGCEGGGEPEVGFHVDGTGDGVPDATRPRTRGRRGKVGVFGQVAGMKVQATYVLRCGESIHAWGLALVPNFI